MASTKPTIAFFGATGGCAATALALALKEGYKCLALARTPTKLSDLLTKQHRVPVDAISTHLTITKGDVRDEAAVTEVLAPSGVPVSIIVSGIGATEIQMQFSVTTPVKIGDKTICTDAMHTILSVLRRLLAAGTITPATRPRLVAISTTGTDTATRDVPLAYYGLYHWLLAMPHVDKRGMEREIALAAGEPEAESPIASFTIVRPTLLMDGPAKGLAKVRSGWLPHPDAPNAPEAGGKPAIGYTIRRADVGGWIFEHCVRQQGNGFENRCATLTY